MNLRFSAACFGFLEQDGSKQPKRVAESCKFKECLIKICVRLYFITLGKGVLISP